MAHEAPSKTIPTNPNNSSRNTMNHGVNMPSYNEVPIYFPTIHPMTVNVDGSREGRMQQTQGFPQQGGNALLMQMASQNTGIINPLYQVQLNNEVIHEEEPFYVNAKQYHRIIKRRHARARLDIIRKALTSGKPYTHESRHRHAMRRPRGAGGRFLTSSEISKMSKEKQENEEKSRESGNNDSDMKSESLDSGSNEKYSGKEEDREENENVIKKLGDNKEKDERIQKPSISNTSTNTNTKINPNANTGSITTTTPNLDYMDEQNAETKEPNVLDTMQMIVSNDMDVDDSPNLLENHDGMK